MNAPVLTTCVAYLGVGWVLSRHALLPYLRARRAARAASMRRHPSHQSRGGPVPKAERGTSELPAHLETVTRAPADAERVRARVLAEERASAREL